jgi:hypothetical protein
MILPVLSLGTKRAALALDELSFAFDEPLAQGRRACTGERIAQGTSLYAAGFAGCGDIRADLTDKLV